MQEEKKSIRTRSAKRRARLLKIKQNSAAILNYDEDKIEGIYTDDLKSCIAILIVGVNGIALIHDDGRLSEKSIADVFKSISPIKSWSIAHNPNSDVEYKLFHKKAYDIKYGNKGIFQTKYERIDNAIKRYIDEETASKYISPDDAKKYYEVRKDFVFIRLNGEINTTLDLKPESDLIEMSSLNDRYIINCLNSSCMEENEFFDVDIQYDGNKETDLPKLVYPLEKIKELAEDDYIIGRFLNLYLQSNPMQVSTHSVRSSVLDVPGIMNFKKNSAEYKSQVLDELERITGEKWKINKDGINVWLNNESGEFIKGIYQHFKFEGTANVRYARIKGGTDYSVQILNFDLGKLKSIKSMEKLNQKGLIKKV